MQIRFTNEPWETVRSDVLLVPVFEDDDLQAGFAGQLNRHLDGLLEEMRGRDEWTGKLGQFSVFYRPAALAASRLVLAGAGPREAYDAAVIRRVIMESVFKVKGWELNSFAVCRRSRVEPAEAAQAAVEGVVLGTYQPDEYKTVGRSRCRLEEILLIGDRTMDPGALEPALRRGEVLGEATNLARSLVNQPGNAVGPAQLADSAVELGERYGLQVDVLGEQELEKEGLHALLAVARGSDEPARLIVMRHQGAAAEDSPLVFLGKGVTFDSGGLSLKTPQGMVDMKTDKAGGCAVIAAMTAVARLEAPRNVIGIVPAVENLPSGRAVRPGDVVRSLCGKTIEVVNTDAEGRLILADALYYARRFEPACLIDLATLTGACVVALGKHRAGLFSNHEPLAERLLEASRRAGESLWRLPLDREFRRELDSDIADLKNSGSRYGGASIGASFLEEFVGDIPWCHLDIAGVDTFSDKSPLKGPTGFGVRILNEPGVLEFRA